MLPTFFFDLLCVQHLRTNINTKLLLTINNLTQTLMSSSEKKSSKKTTPETPETPKPQDIKYCKDVSKTGVKCSTPASIQGGDYCRFHAARIAQYQELDLRNELAKINPELANKLILHSKNGIDPRVERLLIVNHHMPEQRTKEWYDYRSGIMTASPGGCYIFVSEYEYELSKKGIICIDLKGKPIQKKHIGTKRCNCFPGWKQQVEIKCIGQKTWASNRHTRHGVKSEPIITAIYERKTGQMVLEVGIMPHRSIDWIGASPDGIRLDGIMVEIKAPTRDYLTEMPVMQYWIQMQLQMEVCDLDECDFVESRIKDYESKDEFINDKFYNEEGELVYHLTSDGNPKGIVLTIEKNISQGDLNQMVREYVYPFPASKYFESREEEEDWIRSWISEKIETNVDMFIDDDTRVRVSYYKVVEWQNHRIKRDKEWFKLRLPDFQESWNTILKYRKEGVPDEFIPKQKNPIIAKKGECEIDSDDDDEIDDYGHGLTKKWKNLSDTNNPKKTDNPKKKFKQTTIPMLDL